MVKLILFATLLVVTAAPLAAQTPAQVQAEPLVKRQLGETPVDGQCLTRQEIDLIEGLNALSRPTVGPEGVKTLVEGNGDDVKPFDPHYFIGVWEIEGPVPGSALGESGDFVGTETVRHVAGCAYESTIEGTIGDAPFTATALMYYDRRSKYLVRLEDDSRGVQLLKAGRVGGDPGGFYSHHWAAPMVTSQGTQVHLTGRTYITSPYAYRVQTRISEDGGPFINFGTVWWERPLDQP